MAEIVNLRRFKKAKARAAEADAAAENRARHGRAKDERAATAAVRAETERRLDGARLERDGEARE